MINKKRRVLSIILVITLLVGTLLVTGNNISTLTAHAQAQRTGVVVGSNLVRVREGAGTSYDMVTWLVRYQQVDILGEQQLASGKVWYQIGFDYNGNYTTGYMSGDYVMETKTLPIVDSSDQVFEEKIASFPENYKVYLRGLHNLHPNWNFEAVLTGLDWNTVIEEEYREELNLVPFADEVNAYDSAFSWKSIRSAADEGGKKGDFNWETGKWIQHDAGWTGASKEIIAYYMDPRNFMADDSRILQFESLKYEEGVQNANGVAAILQNSFMATEEFYNIFLKAGKEANVSPYLLASRCLQEVGREGSSTTVGTYPGYEGYYNFFNIGASANEDGTGAVENGLKYAKEKGWDTPEKSIVGGASFVGKNYVAKGQNTFYFQKFNVVNTESGLYYHQYMQNLSAASTEGASLRKIHTDWENSAITFRIPVYENMPQEPSPLPAQVTNNYNDLDTLAINGQEVENFAEKTTSYAVKVSGGGVFKITGSCPMPGTKVNCPKEVYLNPGQYTKTVTVTAVDGTKKDYAISFVITEGRKGDADNDGELSALDALIMLKSVANMIQVEGPHSPQMDPDGSGRADANDALMVLKAVAGMIDF